MYCLNFSVIHKTFILSGTHRNFNNHMKILGATLNLKPMLAELCNFVFNRDDNTSRQEISNHCEPNEFLTLSKKHTEPMSSYLSMTNSWFVSFEELGLLATASPHLATSQDG
jgi:hypothetical protein